MDSFDDERRFSAKKKVSTSIKQQQTRRRFGAFYSDSEGEEEEESVNEENETSLTQVIDSITIACGSESGFVRIKGYNIQPAQSFHLKWQHWDPIPPLVIDMGILDGLVDGKRDKLRGMTPSKLFQLMTKEDSGLVNLLAILRYDADPGEFAGGLHNAVIDVEQFEIDNAMVYLVFHRALSATTWFDGTFIQSMHSKSGARYIYSRVPNSAKGYQSTDLTQSFYDVLSLDGREWTVSEATATTNSNNRMSDSD